MPALRSRNHPFLLDIGPLVSKRLCGTTVDFDFAPLDAYGAAFGSGAELIKDLENQLILQDISFTCVGHQIEEQHTFSPSVQVLTLPSVAGVAEAPLSDILPRFASAWVLYNALELWEAHRLLRFVLCKFVSA